MKPKTLMLASVLVCGIALGGCDQVKKLVGGGKPTGQVVATVSGKEITALELSQELGGFTSNDPATMKAAQQRALQQAIMRRILVEKAKEEKLDKTADYTLQVLRGEENLLVQVYQRKIAAAVAAPSRQDAEDYIAAHPEKFSDRKVLVLDQLIGAPSKIPPARFQPLKTMDEVRALYDSERIPYQRNVTTIDTLTVDSRLVEQIGKLPDGEIFVIPQRQALVFNRILDARSVPFTGDPAIAYATNVLRQERAQKAVGQQFEALRKSAEKSIVYSEAYKPPASAVRPKGTPDPKVTNSASPPPPPAAPAN